MTWKSYIAASAVGLVATYVASSPLVTPGTAPSSPAAGDPLASLHAAAEIEHEAARLAAGLRADASFRAPSRNPFRFGEPAAAAPPASAVRAANEAALALPPPAPEPPFVALSGMATDVVDGRTVRTAVLTTAAGVVLAREGDMVGAEYRVRQILDEAVELESTRDGALRQLRFPAGAR